jgi:hypothetical protein
MHGKYSCKSWLVGGGTVAIPYQLQMLLSNQGEVRVRMALELGDWVRFEGTVPLY